MIQKKQHDVWKSSLLTTLGIFHAFSDRHTGDVLQAENRDALLTRIGISPTQTIGSQQVHGGMVQPVTKADIGREVAACDGLVYKDDHTYPVGLRLRVADCVPLIAVDPLARVVGVAHAGWKGTTARIAQTLIETMSSVGAHPTDIYIAIGPHIGMCCYTIEQDRAQMFQKQFGLNEKIIAHQVNQWHTDLGYANYDALQKAGVSKDHIDWSLTCTSCQVSDFYSYRKDTKETFGEQLGIIGFTS